MTDADIDRVAEAIYLNPEPPAMIAIDWIEAPEHIRRKFRYIARIAISAYIEE